VKENRICRLPTLTENTHQRGNGVLAMRRSRRPVLWPSLPPRAKAHPGRRQFAKWIRKQKRKEETARRNYQKYIDARLEVLDAIKERRERNSALIVRLSKIRSTPSKRSVELLRQMANSDKVDSDIRVQAALALLRWAEGDFRVNPAGRPRQESRGS
jgi:hypothetical protein